MRTSKLLRVISLLCLLFYAAEGFGQTQPPYAVPFISQITPASIAPSANPNLIVQFSLTIIGANFPANPVVTLTVPGGPSITATSVNVSSTGTQINAFFNTTLPRPAVYAVTVANPANTSTQVSNVLYLPVTPSATDVGFSKFATTTIGGQPQAVAAGDFNGDGNPDVAILSRNPNAVSIFLGNFSGTLNAGASYPVGNTPTGIVAADFNGDGILDLAVTNSADNTISIFLGSGYGTFQPPITVADTGFYPTQIVAADFNGDGHLDLAVLNLCATAAYCNPPAGVAPTGSVFILLGNGDGTFSPTPSSPITGCSPSGIVAADFNSDGFIDLVIPNQVDNYMTVLMGNGDGTFTPTQSSVFTGYGSSAVAVGDFNGDGALDFAVTNSNSGTVSIFLNQGCGLPATACTFSQTSNSPTVGQYPYGIAVGDMNADGIDDLVVTNFGSNDMTVLVGNGAGGFTYAVPPANSLETFTGGQPGPVVLADFSGDGRLDVLTVNAGSYTLLTQMAMPQVVLTVSSASTTYGQQATFTAQVNPSFGAQPTGTVTLYDSTTSLGTVSLSGYQANFFISTLLVGTHQVTATYNGDTTFQPSTSAPVTETVSQAPTNLTLNSNVNTLAFGQPFTLSATVVISNLGTPTGTVAFFDSTTSTSLGTAAVSNSVAQLTLSTVSPGAHVITASYGGDANFLESSSPTYTENITQASTTTTITTSVNPANYGQTVTLSANVQASGGTPTGSVTFLDGAATLGTATLTNGAGQLVVSTLAAGAHAIAAQYSGDGNFLASRSTVLTQTVSQSSTSTTLVSNLNPATFGQGVPFVATVQTPNGGAATGSVTFYDGASALGTAAVIINNSEHNMAQLTFSGLLGGTHSITAAYSGDANYTASTSSALTETINPASSSLVVSASANPASYGQAVTLTAAVLPSISGDQASGTVAFFDGSTSLGTANLANNMAQISVANFSAGTHSVTASYAGDRNIAGSTSAVLAEVVNPATTSTALSSSANPVLVGQAVTFTAAVSSSIAGTQSGTVSFYLDGSGTSAANVALSGGIAHFSISSLSAGTHTVVAVFASTNPNFGGSASAMLTQSVSDFAIAVSPSSLTLGRQSSGTYTLTVTSVGGFSGTVSLTCTGAPTNAPCVVSPTQLALVNQGSAQATVTITVNKRASNGTHTLTFTATSGSLTHKQKATLVID